jgi:hypothetical protein
MIVQSFVYENAQAASGACARKIIERLGCALASQPRAAMAVFIDPAHFRAANVHRVHGGLPPKDVAKLYDRGMGPDAHAASLLPGEPLIDDHMNLLGTADVENFTNGV